MFSLSGRIDARRHKRRMTPYFIALQHAFVWVLSLFMYFITWFGFLWILKVRLPFLQKLSVSRYGKFNSWTILTFWILGFSEASGFQISIVNFRLLDPHKVFILSWNLSNQSTFCLLTLFLLQSSNNLHGKFRTVCLGSTNNLGLCWLFWLVKLLELI